MSQLILIIIWIIVALFNLQYPVVSIEELKYIPNLAFKLISPEYLWSLRIINISIMLIFIILLIRRHKLKLFSTLILLTSPWLFILAREFNILITFVLILLISIYLFKSYYKLIILFIILFSTLVSININNINIFDRFHLLIQYLSIINPFFQPEIGKFYLYFPKIGYFLYPSLIFLIIGLLTSKINKFLILIIISLLIFLFFPSDYFIMAGIGFIFIMTLFILNGTQLIKRHLLIFAFSIITLINFIFFLEIYFNHNQSRFASERKYEELKIINYIRTKKLIQVFSLENGDIIKWYYIYNLHYKLPRITFLKNENKFIPLLNKCLESNILCIVDKQTLTILKLNENDNRIIKIKNPNNLNRFYLL